MRAQVLPLALLLPALVQGQLNKLFQAKGKKYFGTATDNSELSDSAYVKMLSDNTNFGQLTPGNSMKWDATEPSQNSFSFSGGDQIVSQAEADGQLMRCHNLVWYQQLPNWVSNGQWTNATLIAAMKNHITNVVTHYKGKCYAWDVINEGINDDGTIRQNIFYNTIGMAYFPIAFAAAAAADPNVKLYYNDYNIEYPGAKATQAQNIVKYIKSYGVKMDGIGLESHFIVGETPSQASQVQNMQAFTALGVEVAVTELDVRFSSLPPTNAGLTQQSADYSSTVGACLQVAGCVGVTVWDFDDKYSWIPGTFSGAGDADLYWANLTAKPAYNNLVTLISGSTGTAPSSSSSSAPAPSSTQVPTTISTITTTTTKTTTTTSTTPVSTSGPTAAHYGQCGGQGWTGPTVCASPYTCKYSNAWYSQCL